MRVSRQSCLVLTLLVTVLPAMAPRAVRHADHHHIAPPRDLGPVGFANGNILVHDDGTDVLLVDAQSDRRVGLADSSLRALTTRPVTTVVTTHYHDDHIGGNPHWKAQGARLVAQCNVAIQARKDTTIAEWREWHRTPAPPDALPTECFTDSLTIARKGEQVVLHHVPSAHTDGDLIIWLPGANVLHMGDVLELGAPPFIDYWTGGTWKGMLAAIDAGLAIANDQTIIVPGHGPTTGRAGMAAYRAMLQDVGERVRDAVQRGESTTAIVGGATGGGLRGVVREPVACRPVRPAAGGGLCPSGRGEVALPDHAPMVDLVPGDDPGGGARAQRVLARHALALPGGRRKHPQQRQRRGAHRDELIEQQRERHPVGLLGRGIRVLVEPRQRSGVAARERQHAIAEDPLRVGHVAEHFLEAPLPFRVTVPAALLAHRVEQLPRRCRSRTPAGR
jgi:glyoxylase-like metal-dependent hydrolase (beta-lactamase superfamily II)